MSITANRLSYIFDLSGPSLAIDTACSSSLVALHEARHALLRGEIDCALVGGVNILAAPFGFISFSQATMLSPTGLCRAFSAEADGYVRAEGGVVVVLKTLQKALDDGDRIHAVVCASEVNSDGRTRGISLPSESRQIDLLQSVYGGAGIASDSVVYVEAHGTGTRVGDPIEAAALGHVLGRARPHPLPIGSIKTNIGHAEPAAGLAGLLKATLALKHDLAPRSLHCDNLNPNIDFDRLNLVIAREPTPLPRAAARRYAGVSSFGFGGTSAHVVITDPPAAPAARKAAPRLLMLSAQSEEALRTLADEYARRLDAADPEETLRIVAATDHRRERMRERLVVPAQSTLGLVAELTRFARSGRAEVGTTRSAAIEGDVGVAFVFSGNGAQ
jgi:acyl transferase domain-containing protein